MQAGVELTHQLVDNPEYMRLSEAAIPAAVPRAERRCAAALHDGGLRAGARCDGELKPKLVEMQAFPSIFGYQPLLSRGVHATSSSWIRRWSICLAA